MTNYTQNLNQPLFPNSWGQLVETRDLLFSALVGELTLNKILLESTIFAKSNSSKATKSSEESYEDGIKQIKRENNRN